METWWEEVRMLCSYVRRQDSSVFQERRCGNEGSRLLLQPIWGLRETLRDMCDTYRARVDTGETLRLVG